MAWIKISDDNGGIYAREPDPDPAEIVTVSGLEAEIAELQKRIKAAEANLFPCPEKADERLADVIRFYNEQNVLRDKIALEIEVNNKLGLLIELKAL